MTPFTATEFFAVFRAYNLAVWPAQAGLVAAALVAVILSQRRRGSGTAPAFILAALWLWMGTVYHLAFFASINPAAYLFGALFILQGGLFAHAAWRGQLSFGPRRDALGITGWVLVAYALIGYPAAGVLAGHTYPESPTFGAPCPSVIFTFGLLLWAGGPVPARLLVIPLAWSFLGVSAAWLFGIVEDMALPIAGLVTTALILHRNRRLVRAPLPVSQ